MLIKNEFDRIYTAAGASGMNAFTSEDMTGYFITVPANKLELWMWMESERLLHPVFREFYAERDVVFEERRDAHGIDASGQIHGDLRIDVLGIASLPMAGRRLAFGYSRDQQSPGGRVLRDLLRAPEYHSHSGRGFPDAASVEQSTAKYFGGFRPGPNCRPMSSPSKLTSLPKSE